MISASTRVSFAFLGLMGAVAAFKISEGLAGFLFQGSFWISLLASAFLTLIGSAIATVFAARITGIITAFGSAQVKRRIVPVSIVIDLLLVFIGVATVYFGLVTPFEGLLILTTAKALAFIMLAPYFGRSLR